MTHCHMACHVHGVRYVTRSYQQILSSHRASARLLRRFRGVNITAIIFNHQCIASPAGVFG